jgi:hypothetical protein
MLPYLPAVLQQPKGSLSMERALKQIKEILLDSGDETDRCSASLDDVETMLQSINRE